VGEALRKLSRNVADSLKEKEMHGKVVTLKFRYADFKTNTRQQSLSTPIQDYDDIYYYAQALWDNYGDVSRGVRLLGVTVGHLDEWTYENVRLPLTAFDKNSSTQTKEEEAHGHQT